MIAKRDLISLRDRYTIYLDDEAKRNIGLVQILHDKSKDIDDWWFIDMKPNIGSSSETLFKIGKFLDKLNANKVDLKIRKHTL